jgi:protein arginine kinase
VREAAAGLSVLDHAVTYRVDELPPTDRALLHERHLVSRELAGLDAQHPLRLGAAVILGDGLGVMINEEDHLRLQSLRSGFAVTEAYQGLDRLDRDLGARLPYSFHREFGFLTACPTNVGTGLRASVLIHLPGLVLTKEISRVLTSLQQMGLTYRGLSGEGSDVVGNFFQISNQTTLGRSEEELLDLLLRVVRHVIEREEEARRVLLRDAGYIVEDKLWRAYGTLRYARRLPFDEAMNYLSSVRLAVGLKLISGLSVYTLNKLLIFSQAAHLAAREGRALTESETNLARARYVRTALAKEAGSVD